VAVGDTHESSHTMSFETLKGLWEVVRCRVLTKGLWKVLR
jgi:hypothetical protein